MRWQIRIRVSVFPLFTCLVSPVMKQKCVFVVGPESSGSTYVARIVSTALGRPGWNGRGFNCCGEAMCDQPSDHVYPCTPVPNGVLVCHRSLPFAGSAYPPIRQWKAAYDPRWIVCTRDITISELSRQTRMGKPAQQCSQQSDQAQAIIRSDILGSSDQTFIWSYETFMFLRDSYLNRLLTFLGIQQAPELTGELSVRNANPKYIVRQRRSLFSRVLGR
jgi:hypothetical protein